MSYNRRIEQGYKKIGIKLDEEGNIMKKIYFAHPFDTWRTKREDIIEQILRERGYEVINPFKHEDHLNIKYGVDNYYDNPVREFAEDIVDKDFQMIIECDSYFGWFPKGITTIGTAIELEWASLLDKEIITLSYKPQPFLWMLSDKLYVSYSNFRKDILFSPQEYRYDLLGLLRKTSKRL